MQAVTLLSTVMVLLTALPPPLLGLRCRSMFLLQAALLPLAHIYASGIALAAAMVWTFFSRKWVVPPQVVAIWGIWGLAVGLAVWENGYTGRSLAQIVELFFYAAVVALTATLSHAHEDRRFLLRALTVGGCLLALVFCAVPVFCDRWPTEFRGRNEGAFVIVFTGIIAPLSLMFYEGKRVRHLLLLVVLMSIAATIIAESRASVLVACAITVGSGVFYCSQRTLVWTAAAVTILGLLSLQSQHVQDRLDVLFDTQRNHSNIERLTMIEHCVDMFHEKPWTGWGWGSLEVLLPKYSKTILSYPHPHNTYAHFAAELGVFGLGGLGMLLGLLTTGAWNKYLQRRFPESFLGTFVAAALIVFGCVNDYFYGGTRGVVVAIFIGLVFPRVRLAAQLGTQGPFANEARSQPPVAKAA